MIVDLCAGPGGWDQALRALGRHDVLGVELDAVACQTAELAGHRRLQADISTIQTYDHIGNVQGLVASPPCQGFSAAGAGRGRGDTPLILAAVEAIAAGNSAHQVVLELRKYCKDPRSALVLEPLRWISDLEPQWTAWEQVPAVLPLWHACAGVLNHYGYQVWTGMVQAEQYGVPQTRKRALLLARRSGGVPTPLPTHRKFTYGVNQDEGDPALQPWVSMAEALGWGMTARPSMTVTGGGTSGGGGAEPFGNEARRRMEAEHNAHRWAMRSNYGTSGNPENRGVRTIDEPAATITSKVGRNMWQYVGGGMPNSTRRDLDQPAPTVHFAHASTLVTWQPPGSPAGKPTPGSMRVSIEEASVLQTFPVDYPWQGGRNERYRQIGDAVPPLLAAHMLLAVGVG